MIFDILLPMGAKTFFLSILFLGISSMGHTYIQVPPPEEQLKELSSTEGSLDFRNLRVTVWNIQKVPKNQTLIDLEYLKSRSNLVLIQEAYLSSPFQKLVRLSHLFSAFMAQSFFDFKQVSTGVASFARGTPRKSLALSSPSSEPVLNTPKMLLIQKYDLESHPDVELLVLNIHALNFVSNKYFIEQIQQAIPHIRAHKGPIIFAGDFNTWNSYRHNYVKGLLRLHGLQEVSIRRSTWLTLDLIFIRGFQVKEALSLENITSSDHYPLWAEFSLESH